MKKIFNFLIFVFLSIKSSLIAYSTIPKEFVFELVSEAISKLSDKNLTKIEKEIFIKKIVKKKC